MSLIGERVKALNLSNTLIHTSSTKDMKGFVDVESKGFEERSDEKPWTQVPLLRIFVGAIIISSPLGEEYSEYEYQRVKEPGLYHLTSLNYY